MRRPRRNHSPVFTAKVALAAVEGRAERFDLHAHQIAQWTAQLVARAAEVFAAAEEPEGGSPPIDLKGLYAKIGQQAQELELWAGALGRLPGSRAR